MKSSCYPLRPASDRDHPGLPLEPLFSATLRDLLAACPSLAAQWDALERATRESHGFMEDLQKYRAALLRFPASIAHNSAIARTIPGAERAALAAALARLIAPPIPGLTIEVLGPWIAPQNSRTHQPGQPYWGIGAALYPPECIDPEGPAFVLNDSSRWQDHWTQVPRAEHPDYGPMLCARPVRSPGALLPWANSLLDVSLTEATIDATRADREAATRRELGIRPTPKAPSSWRPMAEATKTTPKRADRSRADEEPEGV